MKIYLISMQGNFRKIGYFQLLHTTILNDFLVFFRPVITKGRFSILPSLYVKNAMNLTSRRCHCEELYVPVGLNFSFLRHFKASRIMVIRIVSLLLLFSASEINPLRTVANFDYSRKGDHIIICIENLVQFI